MIQSQKNKMNLKILEMLRDKGAPSMSPFPGEQEFETEGQDLDPRGNTVMGGIPSDPLLENPPVAPLKRKKLKGPIPTE